MLLYVAFRKYPHPDMVPYCPFSYIAVWAATVVCEASDTAIFSGINELRLILDVIV